MSGRPSGEATGDLRTLSAIRVGVAGLLEPLVRLGGWLGLILGRDRHGVESVIRGRILGGSAGWRVGRSVEFVGPARQIRLGANTCLHGRAFLNAYGPKGSITVGPDSHVDQFCVLYGQGGLSIGRDCAIASGVIIYTQTNADSAGDGTPVARQPTTYAPVRIGDGCWLGAGVRVIPGVTIDSGVHVGAGAVVTADIGPDAVAVGVPARVVRRRGS